MRWAGVDRPRCASRAPTWSGSSPGRRSTGCGRSRGDARRTWGNGCPSRCSPARRRRRTSSWPRTSRSRCSPVLETLGPVERAVFHAARGLRRVRTTRSRRPSARRRPGAPDRPSRRDHVSARRPRMSVNRAEQQAAVEPLPGCPRYRRPPGPARRRSHPTWCLMSDGGGVVARSAISPAVRREDGGAALSRFPARAPGVRFEATGLNAAPALRIDPSIAASSTSAIGAARLGGGRVTPGSRRSRTGPSWRRRRAGWRFLRPVRGWERRGWDSNPRSACTDSGFQDRCDRPLCHPSGTRLGYAPLPDGMGQAAPGRVLR